MEREHSHAAISVYISAGMCDKRTSLVTKHVGTRYGNKKQGCGRVPHKRVLLVVDTTRHEGTSLL